MWLCGCFKKICPAWLEAAFGNVDGRRCVGGYDALLKLCYILDVSKCMKRQKNILLDVLNTKKQTRNKKVSQGLLHFLPCVFPGHVWLQNPRVIKEVSLEAVFELTQDSLSWDFFDNLWVLKSRVPRKNTRQKISPPCSTCFLFLFSVF